jgi:phosphate acyltransferase
MLCGRLKGVSRPTIGAFFPTQTGRPTLLVDAGANVDSKPVFLRDYGIMGSVYSELILHKERPSVGLLNVGEEEGKGTLVVKEAYDLLKAAPVHFVGNVEGRDILKGTVDIVVCDGFEGNIVLKFAESIIGFLKSRFLGYANTSPFHKLILAAFRPVLRKVLSGMDYQDQGGVPLLGINGVVIIGHGSSSVKAVGNMINRAVEMVQLRVNEHIQRAIAETTNTDEKEA